MGTTGYVFLQIPVSARSMALAEAGITLPDVSADGMFINPALIALNDQPVSAAVTYANWYVETTHQAGGITYRIPGAGVVGINAVYFGFGEVERTRNPRSTEFGSYISLGNYDADAYALGLTFAKKLTPQFAFGASIKYVRETIDAWHSSNLITDIGFMYFTGFHSLRIGAFLQNFGLESKYVDEKFKMPQQLKLGISAEIYGSLEDDTYSTLLLEAAHPNDINEHIQIGLENIIYRLLALRAGYKIGFDEEDLTLGLGLCFKFKDRQVRFDMAYMKHDRLDTTMRYTLSMEL